MRRSGLSWDEQNHSEELHDIFSHLIDGINCLRNTLATLDSESLFISFQMNWGWLGSWRLLLCTQKKGDFFSFLVTNLGIILVKLRWNCICLRTWSRSLARMANFWIAMVFDKVQVIVIHQICFPLPMLLVVFSLLGWLWDGLIISHNSCSDTSFSACEWILLTDFLLLNSLG